MDEENNLRVHVSALRKLVGSHQIVTVAGRGLALHWAYACDAKCGRANRFA